MLAYQSWKRIERNCAHSHRDKNITIYSDSMTIYSDFCRAVSVIRVCTSVGIACVSEKALTAMGIACLFAPRKKLPLCWYVRHLRHLAGNPVQACAYPLTLLEQ
jgi:hypothetical protein